jgi:DNA-binding NtrC family response regulator
MSKTILIVDDEADIRRLIAGLLEDEGYKTLQAANSEQAYKAVDEQSVSLIVLDIWLEQSKQDGLEILSGIKAKHPHIPVIMISGHGTIATAVSAIKDGAYDFVEKPFKSDRLLLMVRRALEAAALERENKALKTSHANLDHQLSDLNRRSGVAFSMDAFLEYSLKEARQMFEADYIRAQLERFDGNVSRTAAFVGMERSALHRKMKSLEMGSESELSDDAVIKEPRRGAL